MRTVLDRGDGSAMLAYRFGATALIAALRETRVLFGTAPAAGLPGSTSPGIDGSPQA